MLSLEQYTLTNASTLVWFLYGSGMHGENIWQNVFPMSRQPSLEQICTSIQVPQRQHIVLWSQMPLKFINTSKHVFQNISFAAALYFWPNPTIIQVTNYPSLTIKFQ